MIEVDVIVYDKYGYDLEYPALGRSKTNEMIVLFYNVSRGIVLAQGNTPYRVGHHTDVWDMSNFEFPRGLKVTINNV